VYYITIRLLDGRDVVPVHMGISSLTQMTLSYFCTPDITENSTIVQNHTKECIHKQEHNSVFNFISCFVHITNILFLFYMFYMHKVKKVTRVWMENECFRMKFNEIHVGHFH